MNSEDIIQKAVRQGMLTTKQVQECVSEQESSSGQDLLDIILTKGYLNQIQLRKLSQEDEDAFLSSEPGNPSDSPMEVSDLLPSVEEMSLRPEEEKSPEPNEPEKTEQAISKTLPQEPQPASLPVKPDPPKLPELPKTPMSTPFGKAAVLLKMVTKEQAYDALMAQATESAHKKLGEIMVDKDYLTLAQVKKILARQKTKTMACLHCEKKYQIVLFQAGRSYKCKICKLELEDAKKLKKKKKAENVPEKLQVMGLTQAVPMMKREKKSATLEFIDEKPAKASQPQPIIPDPMHHQGEEAIVELESRSTEEQLKSVGLDIPNAIPGYKKRPVGTRKNFAPFIFSGVVISVVCIIAYIIIMGNSSDKEPEDLPREVNQSSPVKPPVDFAQQAFEGLPDKAANENETDLRDELDACREYLGNYPESSHKKEVSSRIIEIEQTLAKTAERRKWKGEFEEIEDEVKELCENKDYYHAINKLEQFIAKTKGKGVEKNAANLRRDLLIEANEEIARSFARAENMVNEGRYGKAIAIIEKAKDKQTGENKRKAVEMIAKYRRERKKHNEGWNDLAIEIIYEIYPSMLKRDYSDVLDLLDEYKARKKEFTGELELWEQDIQAVQRIWDTLQYRLKLREGKKVQLKLDRKVRRKSSIKGKLRLFSKKDRIDRFRIEKGRQITTINIEWLNEATICHLLADDYEFNDISERAALTMFLLPWKNSETIAYKLQEVRLQEPRDETVKRYRGTIAYYLVAMTHFAIEDKKRDLLEKTLQELDLYFGNTLALDLNKEKLKQEMTSYENKARTKKEAAKIAKLRNRYLRR